MVANTSSFATQPRLRESGLANFLRGALRLWFGLLYRRIRVLNSEAISRSGPALLVVNHLSGFAGALILNAAFDRPVHCLLEHGRLKGLLARACAHSLGVITYEYEGESWPSTLQACCEILDHEGLVVAFARQQASNLEDSVGFAPEAAELALEAQAYLERGAPLPIHPVNLFLPAPPSQSSEVMVRVGAPLSGISRTGALEAGMVRTFKAIDGEIERACRQNPFRLRPEDMAQFTANLEEVMREDFAESWERRAHWKQKVEDFELSPFLVRLLNQLNSGHPGRLVALRESLQAYREARRQNALFRLKTEMAGEWSQSKWRRLAGWIETLLGFPVACYGFLNLLIAWLVIHLSGLLRKGLWDATPREWAVRGGIVLACYAGQIALAAHFLPREEVGYYAPSLFLSGGYFLRYVWLVEHRSKLLIHAAGKSRRAAKLRQLRKMLIGELKRDQDRYATIWKIAH
ncbi:MAG TPA: 1-acyl-sn-glycerol-3-phosphate acyltransferase [Terriglobia bacterium]|nr:1-acyl-sn-glycerol-3-phosphate acyltransferase [Terriglobia bacterium]